MKYRPLSIFTTAALLLMACAEIETPVKSGSSVTAIIEGQQTRTSVTDEGIFLWSSGDQVWLQTTNGCVVGTLSSGAETSRASFSPDAFIGELTGKAVYPYNATHSISGDQLCFFLPTSYDLGSNFTNTNAAMYGVDVDGTIRFNHLCGVMRFVFKNVPAGTDRFQLTLDKKINGIFNIDLSEDLPIIETSEPISESDNTVTLIFDALKQVSDISLYVPLPIGTYTTLGLELWAGDKSVWSYSNTVTNTIGRKTLKLMPAVNLGDPVDGDIEDSASDLSNNGTANSYIVSSAGSYKFTPTKGNSNESVGAIVSAEVLWESFGTNVAPNVGDLVKNVKYSDGTIIFQTPSTFKEGNALIAAKNASGDILWSWHIWLTDQPELQVYNEENTMMDRNLGATSATPGDVGALGLLYQWGRKDPFLGSSAIECKKAKLAESTIIWPDAIQKSETTGTIEYVTANPTTFVADDTFASDWLYSSIDNGLWTTSDAAKSIYDPCPAGWRVPDASIWSSKAGFMIAEYTNDYDNYGISFKISSPSTTWYPQAGCRYHKDGRLYNLGTAGVYWSSSPDKNWSSSGNERFTYLNVMHTSPYIKPNLSANGRAFANSVRCIQE